MVAGLATGIEGEASLSQLYGGKGDEGGAAVPVYTAIGKVGSALCLKYSRSAFLAYLG